ncbi:hypothetical protein COCSUDRAFT_63639 [Coccomyxa subellipsoidea C-169]|uniref:SAC3/GANP/THP3 conserved domain-containing protein n=1 Tax=Coccomyxa subellipsoidea (strain C-169) TaxID=574566 RepID=I0YY16_COCSC|nr:hypothetical protein COCSUDRAFT_63639 [Coccomyxa subellipsoidea C-169]EIE23285.1 hypothetical protein COCSUDRAFT_63639 [Coccomyxa subellipsoidea C-169]|eukprot:XP_005647829.1 hypothetical protein COCSUDRAFT_63639 [Coccomyxa subellipsoidea C-169]
MGKKKRIEESAVDIRGNRNAKSDADAGVQAKKKILKLTKKLQQPGVPPEKKARLLNKLEGSLAKLDSLPGLQTNGHPAGIPGFVTRTPEEEARRQQRAARFQECMSSAPLQEAVTLQAARSEGKQAVYGQNQQLEKEYLRLTSMPTIDAVRPPSVLKKALKHVQQRWMQDAHYEYACEQLKSIRQDLTVQLIRNEFTVHVYETHARIALEQGDLAEFNPCLSLLQQLYADKIEGNETEFMAYGLLYAAVTNPKQLAMELRGVPCTAWQHPYMEHALRVCLACARSDACELLDLYASAPRMTPYLMDGLLERLRVRLAAALSAYSPSVPLASVAGTLGFDTLRQAGEFLERRGAVVDWKALVVVTKQSKAPTVTL